jgi:hypothetical protein
LLLLARTGQIRGMQKSRTLVLAIALAAACAVTTFRVRDARA